ncbi:MAG: DUF4834 domain-containing protein [Porphyromonas sp.]|nr:DUF4834 domain-containing protein [Porphyromonas sp.]
MKGLLLLLLFIPLLLIVYMVIRYRRALVTAYKVREQYKEAKRKAEEERQRQERVRRTTNPNQSTVEMIDDAALDLEGGEYVDFEEIE